MYFTEIPIWELNHRIAFLNESKKDIINYFNDVHIYNYGSGCKEGKIAQQLRPKINRNLKKLMLTIMNASISTSMHYTPPPAVGGRSSDINIIANIFQLYRYPIESIVVMDMIDQAIGVYESEKQKSIFRTINPLWWLLKLFGWIGHIPFMLLKEAGVKTVHFESSFLGKFIKLIVGLVGFTAALLSVLEAFGYKEGFVRIVSNLFKF